MLGARAGLYKNRDRVTDSWSKLKRFLNENLIKS